jgi:acetolactate synthase-1/2/3 large subunit
MATMNGGQALIRSLVGEGVRTVFGVPGAGQYEGVDALYNEPDIRYVSVRHEQEASYMADGYARGSGEIAAVLVVEGPGIFNTMAGIATAFATSTPMLVVTGSQHHRSKGLNLDESAWLGPLTKWVGRAYSPADIPALVQEAFRQLRTGRPRPVAIEIPSSAFSTTDNVSLLPRALPTRLRGDTQALEQATELLLAARRPVIWAGAGVMRANAAKVVEELASYLQIPVVTSRQGKGTIPENHPLCLGMAELRYQPLRSWLADRDLILALGTSQDFSSFNQPIIRVDIDETELEQAGNLLTIHGDASAVVSTLHTSICAATPARTVSATSVQSEVTALNAERFDPTKQLQPQWGLMQAIRSALPANGLLVQGMNQMGYYSRTYFSASAPRSYLTASSHATLGCAYPIALGAKMAQPDRPVVSLSGDGGFLYNAQALATAVLHGINAVAIVFNDNAYGNVLRAQMEEFDGRVIGTRLHNPDFVALAASFGVRGLRVTDAETLRTALSDSLAIAKPTLIEVPVGMMERVY